MNPIIDPASARRPARRKYHIVTAAVGALVVLGGIGALVNRKLDTNDMDRKLSTWATDHVAAVASVACPKDVKEDAGGTFDCQVTFATGRVANVHVVQRDGHGDVKYYWSPPIVDGEKVAAVISANEPGATVDCGKGILDVPPAGLTCTLARGATTRHFIVTIHDGEVATREEP